MNDGNDQGDSPAEDCHPRAVYKPRRYPAASHKLIADGLITPQAYEEMLAAHAASWNELMTMDEPQLDAELGEKEVQAINAWSEVSLSNGRGATAERPRLQIVKSDDRQPRPEPYREHYRIRLAGLQDGLMLSKWEIEEEIKDVKRLLMASSEAENRSADAFMALFEAADEGRMLLIERIDGAEPGIVGCVVYEHEEIECYEGAATPLVRRRLNVIRHLAVKSSEHCSEFSVRLALEAQLRGTVRAMRREDRLACTGTLGVIAEMNVGTIACARQLTDRVRVIPANRSATDKKDAALVAFRDLLDAERQETMRDFGYWLVIANRMQLLEAAHNHACGAGANGSRGVHSAIRIDYEIDDPCAHEVMKAATELAARKPDAMARFGLTGPRDATIWGPPLTQNMADLSAAAHAGKGRILSPCG